MSLTDGIVGCWSPSVRGSGYLLPDLSGRGNHGTLTNMDAADWPGAVVRGVHGRVLDYDGSNDQTVSTLAMPAAPSRTVAMWVLSRTTANSWCFGTNYGFNNSGLFLGIEQSALTVTQYGNAIRDTTTFPTNVWQHICTTHVGNSYRLYRNGLLVNTGAMLTTPMAAVAYLGSYGNGGYWNGQIGESLFFERAISDAELLAIYQQGNGAIGRQRTGQTRRRVYGFVPAAGFRAYWARRQSQIIGGGV